MNPADAAPNRAEELGGIGQVERLTVRLKDLISNYPLGPGLVKEFVQNADDARATRVDFILDTRTHSHMQVHDAEESNWLGPALLVSNDSIFQDEDFDGIQRLGEGSKENSGLKIGRFGLGFNTAYNITDTPCFLSRNRFIFFDPHLRHLQAQKYKSHGGGWQVKFKWNEFHLWQLFEAAGVRDDVSEHQGTVFRLPLRTVEQSTTSEITQSPCTIKSIRRVFENLVHEIDNQLLFLKSVREITFREIDTEGQPHDVLSVCTLNPSEVTAAKQPLLDFVSRDCEDVLDACEETTGRVVGGCFRHRIETRHRRKSKTHNWSVCIGLFSDEAGKVVRAARKLHRHKGKALPWAGAAVQHQEGNDLRLAKIEGRAFCFLPLPDPTGLPVHLHGYFDLDSSRQRITSDNSNQGEFADRIIWNQALIQHAVSAAYSDLLSHLSQQGLDPSSFYEAWPQVLDSVDVLAALPHAVYAMLGLREVVSCQGSWAKVEDLYIPPLNWTEIHPPLLALRIPIPEPALPLHIIRGFEEAEIGLDWLTPANLRAQLKDEDHVAAPLSDLRQPAFRRKDWLVDLLRFCLKDEPGSDLMGVPLALLADGKLHTFGKSGSSLIHLADDIERSLFAKFPHWFLDQEFAQEAGLTEEIPSASVAKFGLKQVILNLASILDPERTTEVLEWLPQADEHPNEEWLTSLLRYLASKCSELFELPASILENLCNVPWIPADDGYLHLADSSLTPLLKHSAMQTDHSLQVALSDLDIPFVTGGSQLIKQMERLCDATREYEWVRCVSGPHLLEYICGRYEEDPDYLQDVPVKAVRRVLTFLAEERWDKAYSKELLERASAVPILSAMDDSLVAANNSNVFLADHFKAPAIGTPEVLLKNGTKNWSRFVCSLGVSTLEFSTYLIDTLIPSYPSLIAEDQRAALAWLVDNFDEKLCKPEMRIEGDEVDVKAAALSASWIHTSDGSLRPAGEVYDPEVEIVQQVLGSTVPYPDEAFYEHDFARWLPLLRRLNLATEPRAQDLVNHIDQLIEKAAANGVSHVRTPLLVLLKHIDHNWRFYSEANVSDDCSKDIAFAEALANRAWLPAKISHLGKYFAAEPPLDRLYQPSEIYTSSFECTVAGQAATLSHEEPSRAFRDALRFPSTIPLDLLLSRFDQLLAAVEALKGDLDKKTGDSIRLSLGAVYRQFSYICSNSNEHDGDKDHVDQVTLSLRETYQHRPCIWEPTQGKLYVPNKVFRESVPDLHPLRTMVRIEKQPDIDRGLFILGRKNEPNAIDLIEHLVELSHLAGGEHIEDPSLLRQILGVYTNLAYLLSKCNGEVEPSDLHRAPVLTRDNRLVEATQTYEFDTNRFDECFGDSVHSVHPHLDLSLRKRLQIRKLSQAVRQVLIGQPEIVRSGTAASSASKLTELLRSKEFHVGLQRILQSQLGGSGPIQAGWLQAISLIPVRSIRVQVTLDLCDGTTLNGKSDGFRFFNSGPDIYLAEMPQGVVPRHVSCAIAERLLPIALKDLSVLSMILAGTKNDVEDWLTQSGLPDLIQDLPDEPHGSEEKYAIPNELDWGSAAGAETDESSESDGQTQDSTQGMTGGTPSGADSQESIDSTTASSDGTSPPTLADTNRTNGQSQPADADQTAGYSNSRDKSSYPPPRDQDEDATTYEDDESFEDDSDQSKDGLDVSQRTSTDRAGWERQRDKGEHKKRQRRKKGRGGSRTPSDSAPGRSRSRTGRSDTNQSSKANGRFVTYIIDDASVEKSDDPFNDEQPRFLAVAEAAVEAVLTDPVLKRWKLEEKAHNNPGYDILATCKRTGEIRYIEVKGVRGSWGTEGVPLTKLQAEWARQQGKQFWLFVVDHAEDPSRREIYRVRDPLGRANQFRFDSGWAAVAKADGWDTYKAKTKVRSEPSSTPTNVRVEYGEQGRGTIVKRHTSKFGEYAEVHFDNGMKKKLPMLALRRIGGECGPDSPGTQ